jgi:hypothetical protein
VTCDELRPRAAGLCTLPPDDPEHQQALAHARSCRECEQALSEGRRLLALLARDPAPAPPSAEAMARVSGAVLAELARETAAPSVGTARAPAAASAARPPARRARLASLVAPLFVLASFGLLVAVGHRHHDDRDSWMEALLLAVASAVFAVTATLRGRLAMAVVAAGSALFALGVGAGAAGLAPSVGVHCVLTELLAAVLPLGLTLVLALRGAGGLGGTAASGGQGGPPPGPALFGAVAGVGALAGQAGLHLCCPVRSLAHLTAFHAGGVLLAMLVGLLMGQLPALRRSG